MADTPLPYADRIEQSSSLSNSERFITVQYGDGYTQMARDGLNSRQQTWSLTWKALTADEARTLKNVFEFMGGNDTVSWQHPLADAPEKYTVTEHSATPNSIYWDYTATLVRRYI